MKYLFPLVLWCSFMSCRTHMLEDGVYSLSSTETLRDDCDLAKNSGVVTTGVLRTTGHVVAIDYAFLQLELGGTYKSGLEEFILDGVAVNVSTDVRGKECLLDGVSIHLDGAAKTSTTFDGAMSVSYVARQPDSCVCEYWFRYNAVRTGDAPKP